MAEPADFHGSNYHFGPPEGLDEMVGHLHVFSNGQCNVSAWRPTPDELAELNAGGCIFVSVMSDMGNPSTPRVYPMYVGTEENCRAVVSDTGKVW